MCLTQSLTQSLTQGRAPQDYMAFVERWGMRGAGAGAWEGGGGGGGVVRGGVIECNICGGGGGVCRLCRSPGDT